MHHRDDLCAIHVDAVHQHPVIHRARGVLEVKPLDTQCAHSVGNLAGDGFRRTDKQRPVVYLVEVVLLGQRSPPAFASNAAKTCLVVRPHLLDCLLVRLGNVAW